MKRFVRKIGRAGIALLTAAALVCIGGGCKIDTEDSPNGKPAIDNPAGGSEDDKNTPGNGNGDNNETVNGGGNDSNNGGSTSDNNTENTTGGSGGSTEDTTGSGNGDNTGDTTGGENGGSTGDATGSGSGDNTGDTSGDGNGSSTGDASGSGSGDNTGDTTGGGNGGNTDETTGGGSEDTAPAYSLEGLILKGGWEANEEDTFTLTSRSSQTITTTGGLKVDDDVVTFGIYNAGGENIWTGSSIPLRERTKLTYTKDGGAPATMAEPWEADVSYEITLELTSNDGNNPELYITVRKM